MDDTTVVSLDARGIRIRGVHTLIMSSSLFYFRIPEGDWEDRMEKIANAGYNAIDVYFPWNFHETSPGEWDFSSGMRNVRRFLDLAARRGLYVIARPGPYICSEWDGGGIPAWLSAEGLALRQNDPAFLSRVRGWFHRVLPVIAGFQPGRGGTVILMQVENELDFFDCKDPAGYLSALRDMALAEEIRIPLIACAGQGDLKGAWAGVQGISPAVNMYMGATQPGLERDVAAYNEGLARLGHPLMITETGREILLLRRLLSAGAKLIGPYNQVAGCDFGFTASVNNWGHPLAFQTTHYDFNSLVGSFGEVRADSWEDTALGGLIRSLGPVLAAAEPCTDHGITVEEDSRPFGPVPVLRLFQKGEAAYAAAVTNVNTAPLRAVLRGSDGAPHPMSVGGRSSAFAFFNLSLAPWELPGRILFSSAEPFMIRPGKKPVIVFQALGGAQVVYDLGEGVRTFTFDGKGIAREGARIPGGGVLVLYGMGRRDVNAATLSAGGELSLSALRGSAKGTARAAVPRKPPALTVKGWRLREVANGELFSPAAPMNGGTLAMEANGAFRGFALYSAKLPSFASSALGVLLHDAADVVSAYLDGRHLGTAIPGGTGAYFPFPSASRVHAGPAGLEVRAEIWGHTNFDDPRLPAMRIGSLRGFSRATLVMRMDQAALWTMDADDGDRSLIAPPDAAHPPGLPYLSPPGSRLTGRRDPRYRSSCTVIPEAAMERFFLMAENAECASLVRVDGRECGWVDRFHPFLDLTDAVRPGRSCRIELEPRKWYAAESAGTTFFLQGTTLGGWSFSRADEPELSAAADGAEAHASRSSLPLTLAAGRMAWLFAALPAGKDRRGLRLTLRGTGIKASVLLGSRLVGRLFLESKVRPKMAGGLDNVVYLPACWRTGEADRLSILLEAVDRGRISSVDLEPVL